MNSREIRQKFLSFFEERGHKVVTSSSLVPDDPSVLLTTAGMQQFKKYFTGELDAEKDFGSLNTTSIQKSFRTSDIDEVGDESHLTFFEMFGNFSFGGYFKEEAIRYGYEFITKVMGLEIDYVTVFDPKKVSHDDWRAGVPFDEESYNFWKKIAPEVDVRREGVDNFWGPTGSEGPCGPTTEIYVNGALRQAQGKPPVEVWNIVFNQFYCDSLKKLTPLKIQGVDTGMGLERLVMVSQDVPTIFDTDLFASFLSEISLEMPIKIRRIAADHARGIVFLISDGVRPSNKDAGYVLRRLVRRFVMYSEKYKFDSNILLGGVVREYGDFYDNLSKELILEVFSEERKKFLETLDKGIKELEKLQNIDAVSAFSLFSTYGLPYEVIKEVGSEKAKNLTREDFDKEFEKHQEISRAGQEKKFGGHGLILDTGELKAGNEEELKKVLRLHTATHLLQAALRKVLGSEVGQAGSDITVDRTRFDFTFPRKLTPEEISKVEKLVNDVIAEDLPVQKIIMPKEEAEKTGALYFFKEKYPDPVNVYFVGKDIDSAFSKEFCGGPHVTHTGEIGHFRIKKEESVGAGLRRIRGVVE
ncbi:MAG: alanine--tRNA ligase [Candidatus Harrisonbacteria bacterium CG10_big_fil_rev_8_21_14_0_10_40_38]|uniref:alanine--tRNA ligase n=1 Tax=Candidatus Harrisonbacteria bacterium CG10_big_fil_rev_8_21_14_0_10_40_38 TaxID=1974583 RepID=A0A2H0US61_9BACT|nr:MAG: alanine--tRNA ligase [Candidatus Harrisonbacteria bacterium CG10_big_fil_rev_8_21_14_0_10_40_38]